MENSNSEKVVALKELQDQFEIQGITAIELQEGKVYAFRLDYGRHTPTTMNGFRNALIELGIRAVLLDSRVEVFELTPGEPKA